MKIVKKIFLILFVFFIGILTVNAETKNIKVTDVTVKEKSTTIEVADPVISDNEITSNITFNQLNDYVTFELTLKNNESEKYKITSITDNNTSNNIEVEYDYPEDFISSNDEAKIRVKLTYKSQLTNSNISLDNLTITFNVENESGETNQIVLNPNTGDNVLHYLVLLIIAITGLILITRKKKKKIGALVLAIGLIIIPFAVLAQEKFELNFKFTNIEVKGEFEEYNVTVDKSDGSEPTTLSITYGETIGELPDAPVKEGHTFVGWIDEQNREVTEDTVITGPINITPVYKKDKHQLTITHPEYLNEGNISGQYEYGTQITLTAKSRDGFTFSKWSDDVTENPRTITIGTSDVTIEPIYTENGPTSSKFKKGEVVNQKMQELAGDKKKVSGYASTSNATIVNFKKSEISPDLDLMTEDNILSTDDSDVPIYVWWDNDTKTIYWWSSATTVYMNEDSTNFFQGMYIIKNINLSGIDTSKVTKMGCMFRWNKELEYLDLSSFDTSNVVYMNDMFSECLSLTYLNLSSFNTSKVEYMNNMFESCEKIEEIDISTFNSSSLQKANTMFSKCFKLTTIYTSKNFAIPESKNIFSNSNLIVGGKGSKIVDYSSIGGYYLSDDYYFAHVDDGICDPGYFTYKYDALISFDPNGGTSSVESRYYDSSTTYNTLPRPYKKGYLFDGWYTEAESGNKVVENDTPVDGLILYAHWNKSRDRDVQLADNGDGEVSKGDYVRIGDEEFYVAYVEDSTTYMLTKNYLDANYRQSENNYINVAFSGNDYWNYFGATSTSAQETIGDYYRIDSYGNPFVYEDWWGFYDWSDEEPNNNITEYIKNYEEHLRNDLEVKGLYYVTLPSYENAKGTIICEDNDYVCKEIFKGKDNGYWLGSVYNDEYEYRDEIFYITDKIDRDSYSKQRAIRPMVVIGTNEIKMSHIVTLDANGGTTSHETTISSEIAEGRYYNNYPRAIKEGCNFLGWYTEPEGGEKVSSSFSPTEDITLYAHYEEREPLVISYKDVDNDNTISFNDIIKFNDDMFYVLEGPDIDGKVKLMAKGELDYNDRLANEGIEVSFCDQSIIYYFERGTFPVDSYGYKYAYRTVDGKDTPNNIYPHINTYKDYLKNDLGIAEIIDARLMSYEEATNAGCTTENYSCKIGWLASWSWFGSMRETTYTTEMWFNHGVNNLRTWPIEFGGGAIQPLVEVDQSVFANAIPITD